jgi:hypothetical protein
MLCVALSLPTLLQAATIKPVVPTGYCKFGDHPEDAQLKPLSAPAPMTEVVSAFVDCVELGRMRAFANTRVKTYGQIILFTPPPDVPQSANPPAAVFVQTATAGLDIQAGYDKIRRVYEGLKQERGSGVRELGIIAKDANAFYVAHMTKPNVNVSIDNPIVIAVIGVTILGGERVMVPMYRSYRGIGDVEAALRELKPLIASLQNANPTPAAAQSEAKGKKSARR